MRLSYGICTLIPTTISVSLLRFCQPIIHVPRIPLMSDKLAGKDLRCESVCMMLYVKKVYAMFIQFNHLIRPPCSIDEQWRTQLLFWRSGVSSKASGPKLLAKNYSTLQEDEN